MTVAAPFEPDLVPVLSDEQWWARQEAMLFGVDAGGGSAGDGSTVGRHVDTVLTGVDDGVSTVLTLLDDGATALAPGELVELLRRIEQVRRRLPAIEHRLIAQIAQRGVAAEYAQPSPAKLMATQLTLTPGEASARVRAAAQLGPRAALDGQRLTPDLELVAEAQQAGYIGERHASVIARAMHLLPPTLGAAERDQVESALVDHAVGLDAHRLAQVAQRVLDHVDPDGREPATDRISRNRDLRCYAKPGGGYRLTGDLTDRCGVTWTTILDALAKPVPDTDGLTDDRSPGQRRHDAFLAAGTLLLRADQLPDCGGVPATIIVRVDADDLAARTGFGRTAHGELWPMADLVDSVGDQAQWVTVFGSATDGVLAYGTDRRFASPGQTAALIARDGGCSFPGCDVPAAWTERHHIVAVVPRRPGDAPGPTDIINLTLLCCFHHASFEAAGWECQTIDGRPYWRPPAAVDPERRPRRNTYWDSACSFLG